MINAGLLALPTSLHLECVMAPLRRGTQLSAVETEPTQCPAYL
jgi:hypothetical protein